MKYDVYLARKDKDSKKLYPLGPFDKDKHIVPVLLDVVAISNTQKADVTEFNDEWKDILADKTDILTIKDKDVSLDPFIKKGYVPAIKLLDDEDYIPKGKETIVSVKSYVNLLKANAQGSDITKEILDAKGNHYMDAKAKDLIGHTWADLDGPEFVCYMLRSWVGPEFEFLDENWRDGIYYVFVGKEQ